VLWEILETKGAFIITYRDQAVSIRSTTEVLGGTRFKYRKMLVNNEGNARLEVKRLNEQFNTDDFGYMRIEGV
jgi:hypothetical protein